MRSWGSMRSDIVMEQLKRVCFCKAKMLPFFYLSFKIDFSFKI